MARSLLGSADFVENYGEEAAKDFSNLAGRLLIGHPVTKTGRTLETFLTLPPRRHVLTVAPNRSGKGTTLIIPNLLNYAGSCLVIDPKGENAYLTAPQRRKLGQKTIILDPWGEVNRRYGQKTGELETVSCFNPLSILDPCASSYADDLAYLADALIISQSKSDPFFDESARELVAGLMAYAVEKDGKHATIDHVRRLIRSPSSEIAILSTEAGSFGKGHQAPAARITKPRRGGPKRKQGAAQEKAKPTAKSFESLAAQKLAAFSVPGKTLDNILMTARAQLQFLDSDPLLENMASSDFSFDDLTERPTTIYLVLPVDKLDTKGRWLRLMVSIAIRQIARNEKILPLPVLFMLDEFGTIGKLNAVARAFGLMSGLQMCVWAFLQDLNQLKSDYPNHWETFIGNTEGLTAFSVMDNFTAEYVSKMCGQSTVEFSQLRNVQHFGRPLMTPDEVRTADFSLLVTRAGPFKYQPRAYYEEPYLSSVARENPYYSAPQPEPMSYGDPLAEIREERRQYWNYFKTRFINDEEAQNLFDPKNDRGIFFAIIKRVSTGFFFMSHTINFKCDIFTEGLAVEDRLKKEIHVKTGDGAGLLKKLFLSHVVLFEERREIESGFTYIFDCNAERQGWMSTFYFYMKCPGDDNYIVCDAFNFNWQRDHVPQSLPGIDEREYYRRLYQNYFK